MVPDIKVMDGLITRLVQAGWIFEGLVKDDAVDNHPFVVTPTPIGQFRFRELHKVLNELGEPGLNDTEWSYLLGLVIRYSHRHDTSEPPQ